MAHPKAPNPHVRYPLSATKRVVFLKDVVRGDMISVGEYSYYDDPKSPETFQEDNVLYHYDFVGDRLEIGRYCALGTGTSFIMNGANHRLDGPSTFPFPIFGESWAEHMDLLSDLPLKGDTIVGHDVWFGFQSLIMPGVRIGHGAIIASRAVVVDDVPPYAIVGGNPAKIIKMRFDDATIEKLLAATWWDWPVDKISRHIRAIMAGNADALLAAH